MAAQLVFCSRDYMSSLCFMLAMVKYALCDVSTAEHLEKWSSKILNSEYDLFH